MKARYTPRLRPHQTGLTATAASMSLVRTAHSPVALNRQPRRTQLMATQARKPRTFTSQVLRTPAAPSGALPLRPSPLLVRAGAAMMLALESHYTVGHSARRLSHQPLAAATSLTNPASAVCQTALLTGIWMALLSPRRRLCGGPAPLRPKASPRL